jgi:hypothetical protein
MQTQSMRSNIIAFSQFCRVSETQKCKALLLKVLRVQP